MNHTIILTPTLMIIRMATHTAMTTRTTMSTPMTTRTMPVGLRRAQGF